MKVCIPQATWVCVCKPKRAAITNAHSQPGAANVVPTKKRCQQESGVMTSVSTELIDARLPHSFSPCSLTI